MGFSVKKAVKSVGKAVTHSVKSLTNAPGDALKSVAKGDIIGLTDAAIRWNTLGTVSLTNSIDSLMGHINGGVDQTGVSTLEKEAEDIKNRRQRLFSTSGGASGQEVLSVGTPAGRGTLFGN